jgi:cytochrome b561
MSQSPSATRTYNAFAKVLHWAIALVILAQFVIASTMPDMHHDTRPDGEIAWHLSVGALILLLVVVRVGWRIARPPVTAGVERGVQHRIAQATHGLLYLGMLVIPVLGWASANSRGWVVGVCSGFPLPKIMATGAPFGHELGDIHGTLAWVLLGLVGLHVAGGLYHQFVLKDDTLQRMR